MNVPSAPPPGTNYLAIIKPSLNEILIAHTFSIVLIPLLILLFYFSSTASRKHPIFILNVITIILAIAADGLLSANAVSILHIAVLSELNVFILVPSNPLPL
jgi:hypothetical protein